MANKKISKIEEEMKQYSVLARHYKKNPRKLDDIKENFLNKVHLKSLEIFNDNLQYGCIPKNRKIHELGLEINANIFLARVYSGIQKLNYTINQK